MMMQPTSDSHTRVTIYNFGCFPTKFGRFTLQRKKKAYGRLQLATGMSLTL